MSMRRFARTGFIFALFAVVLPPAARPAGREEAPARVLLIGKEPDHPHGSHMYLHTSRLLAECLKGTPGVEPIVSSGWPREKAQLEGVRGIVVYTDPAAELLFDAGHRDEVKRLLDRGAGLVTIHWASSVRQANFERLGPEWLAYLGGTWVSNVGLEHGTSQLKQLAPEHPIHRGWREFEIRDEFYLNPTIGEGATPLLRVTRKDGGEVIVGWAFERAGGGRSFGTTLGHPYANFQRDDFRRLLVNAILWTAQLEVPEGGAPIVVGEELLALPPK